MYKHFFKRVLDILAALIGLPFFVLLFIIFAPIIYFTDRGPVFYNAPRLGKKGRIFRMYKFRSMTVNAPDIRNTDGSTYNGANDPRVTKIGRLMRKLSIDETPQLLNVLKGDMSLVGPRPERPFFVEKFREEIPRYMVKHQVRPGLTGWAQVNGYRGNTSIRKRIDYDLYYIENWSVGLDVKIILLTFFKGFINKNAY